MILIEQVEKCQTQSILVILVCGKILHKAPFSNMYEPGGLILLKVILEMELLVQKNRESSCIPARIWERTKCHVTAIAHISLP